LPAGTIIDHQEAWKLVQSGMAVPEDEECAKRVNMNPAQMATAQVAQEKARLGVAPEDYQAYDDGLMRGYKPDGSWIPGPNFDEYAWNESRKDSPIILEDE
jgi:hypothetical protein